MIVPPAVDFIWLRIQSTNNFRGDLQALFWQLLLLLGGRPRKGSSSCERGVLKPSGIKAGVYAVVQATEGLVVLRARVAQALQRQGRVYTVVEALKVLKLEASAAARKLPAAVGSVVTVCTEMLQTMVNTLECMLFYIPQRRQTVRLRATWVHHQAQHPRAGGGSACTRWSRPSRCSSWRPVQPHASCWLQSGPAPPRARRCSRQW